MLSEDSQVEIMLEGLIFYIMELDPLRPPVTMGFVPFSGTFFEFLLKQNQRFYFIRNNPDLHQKVRKDLDAYFTEVEKLDARDFLLYFVCIFLLVLVTVAFLYTFILIGLNQIYTFFCIIIMFVPSFILIILWLSTRRKHIAGEEHNIQIKKAVQELIDYGIELIRTEDLDPKDFPIKLRHNDYKGLEYEIRDKNNYVGVYK